MDKTFEQSYSELQQVIMDLQDENKTLDESIENFKKAVQLQKQCQEKLDTANEQIVELVGEDDAEDLN